MKIKHFSPDHRFDYPYYCINIENETDIEVLTDIFYKHANLAFKESYKSQLRLRDSRGKRRIFVLIDENRKLFYNLVTVFLRKQKLKKVFHGEI